MNFYYHSVAKWLAKTGGIDCVGCHRKKPLSPIVGLCQECLSELEREVLNGFFQSKQLPVTALFEYCGLAKQLVRQAKFKNCLVSASVIGAVTVAVCEGKLGQPNGLQPFELQQRGHSVVTAKTLLVPVPCSLKSMKQRGWDLVVRMTYSMEKSLAVATAPFIIRNKKGKNKAQQKQLNREQRLKSAVNRFALSKDQTDFQDKKILLVDDVMTTGATLEACGNLLQEKGVTQGVEALVFCCD